MTMPATRTLASLACLSLWAGVACGQVCTAKRTAAPGFGAVKVVCQQLGDESGALYCPEGRCTFVPHGPDEADVPAFLTTYRVQLGAQAPTVDLLCNGAGTLACVVPQPEAPLERRLMAAHAVMPDITVSWVAALGDGCLVVQPADTAMKRARRKLCWDGTRLSEKPPANKAVPTNQNPKSP